jgi:hypothetical protein
MFDFLVKNAALPDGRKGIDIAGKDGLITTVGKIFLRNQKKLLMQVVVC